MPWRLRGPDHGGMTPSATPRYVLVPTSRADDRDAQFRRYRLARLRMDALRRDASGPFAHLKRTYD